MERGGGSGERSRIAAKTPRSSSGCLSFKEKRDGLCRTVSSNFQKKRSKVVVSDSESSDEFMKPPPRSVDRKTLGAKEKWNSESDCDEPIRLQGRNGVLKVKVANKTSTLAASVSHQEAEIYERPSSSRKVQKRENVVVKPTFRRSDDVDDKSESEEMKMDKVDVFEFDEYDGFDSANLMRKRFDNGSVGVSGRSSFAPRRVDNGSVGGSGSGRGGVFVRREKPYVNGATSMSSQEKLSSSESDSDSDGPIRVQGRNGVLKVKVTNKTSARAASINHQEPELYERPASSRKVQKRENVAVKPTFRKSNNVDYNSEAEESDISKRKKPECQKSNKEMNTKSKSNFSEPVKPAVRRGGGTEKQRLREKIKGMLIDAGWTVDYRPRRNRSYMDAVYVSPSGIAYWSIIKAYEALRKQFKDEEIDARFMKDAAAVASVSEDVVNKLARKVKKTQTEMTKKWKKDFSGSESEKESDEGGVDSDSRRERMGSFVMRGRNETDRDDLHSKSKSFSYYKDARPSSGSDSHYLHGIKSKKIGRCTLKVRSSEDKRNPAIDGFNPYSGERTLLSWLIECGVVRLRQKVQYMNHQCTKVMLEGWITRAGIHCVCCSKILTVSRFEIHAGSKLCQPFQNIYLESGSSLHHCQIKAWNMQKDAKNLGFHHVDTDGDDPNDDACGICGDGGDLICCDGCPSTYHQTCLGIEVLPRGDWHCPNCTCKFCDTAVYSGGDEGDHLSLLFCNMCERRYHQSCMNELEAHNVQSFGSASSFCGPKCLELFEKLQKYLGVKNEIEGGYSWSLIHRMDADSNSSSQLSAQRIETNSKLAVGLAIMDECFLPIIDRRSGVNLIRNVLYNCGSNFNRINYSGFYTAILERGDEIISAASLRFHGMQLAEMPFIGTRHIYRRQGMCRRLFDAIESAIRSLKVEKLVIPAIPDFLQAWTGNFGFSPLDESVRKEMRSLNTLAFPGINMLQKPLVPQGNVIAAAAAGDSVVVHKDAMTSETETEKKSNFASSAEIGLHSSGYVAGGEDCHKNICVSDEEIFIFSRLQSQM